MAYRTIAGAVMKATPKAVLVGDATEQHWIPRSVCDEGDELDVGDDARVEQWFLDKEGIDY